MAKQQKQTCIGIDFGGVIVKSRSPSNDTNLQATVESGILNYNLLIKNETRAMKNIAERFVFTTISLIGVVSCSTKFIVLNGATKDNYAVLIPESSLFGPNYISAVGDNRVSSRVDYVFVSPGYYEILVKCDINLNRGNYIHNILADKYPNQIPRREIADPYYANFTVEERTSVEAENGKGYVVNIGQGNDKCYASTKEFSENVPKFPNSFKNLQNTKNEKTTDSKSSNSAAEEIKKLFKEFPVEEKQSRPLAEI